MMNPFIRQEYCRRVNENRAKGFPLRHPKYDTKAYKQKISRQRQPENDVHLEKQILNQEAHSNFMTRLFGCFRK
uniref:Uncharacterized protein n=1 Tax=Acrobeloides nanus TaxID=290746 RepID=A0A914DCA0_9BILA